MGRQTDPAGHHNNLSLNKADTIHHYISPEAVGADIPTAHLSLDFSLFPFQSLDLLCCQKKNITGTLVNSTSHSLSTFFNLFMVTLLSRFYDFLSPNVFVPWWPGCFKYRWVRSALFSAVTLPQLLATHCM